MIGMPFIFLKLYHRWLYNQGNNFRVEDGLDIDSYLASLGFTKRSDYFYELKLNDDTYVYAWVWHESIWCSDDIDGIKKFLYNVCTQFGGDNCERFV